MPKGILCQLADVGILCIYLTVVGHHNNLMSTRLAELLTWCKSTYIHKYNNNYINQILLRNEWSPNCILRTRSALDINKILKDLYASFNVQVKCSHNTTVIYIHIWIMLYQLLIHEIAFSCHLTHILSALWLINAFYKSVINIVTWGN